MRKRLQGVGGGIELPLLEAFRISVEHIRRRLKRSIILVGSIGLAISLLTHLEVANIIQESYMRSAGVEMEAYQLWLIVVSLLVCGISLVNANLIAIFERYREIGTMKCLGALDQHVVELYMIESLVLGLIGGLLGFSIGAASAIASSSIQIGENMLLFTPLGSFLQSLASTIVLSILLSAASTVYPVLRATRITPVEALRHSI